MRALVPTEFCGKHLAGRVTTERHGKPFVVVAALPGLEGDGGIVKGRE